MQAGTRRNNNDVADNFDSPSEVIFYEKNRSVSHIDFHLDEAIGDARFYRPIYQRMLDLSPEDSVSIYIDSPGGVLQGCQRILQAMDNTEADVEVIITGLAGSAASIIALSAEKLIVTEESVIFIHSASMGSMGKMQELIAGITFEKEHAENLMKKAYEGFLTDDEIEQVFIGRDFYFDSKEIIRRLEIREELRNKPAGKPVRRTRKAKVQSDGKVAV